jgi:hypothetical protein
VRLLTATAAAATTAVTACLPPYASQRRSIVCAVFGLICLGMSAEWGHGLTPHDHVRVR